jgi:hypothetical protein
MGKKNSGIYAPGELSRVREKLGVTDEAEAKRMMNVLGGEVGTERTEEMEASRNKKKSEPVVTKGEKRRRIDIAAPDEDEGRPAKSKKQTGPYPGDDPSVPLKLSYSERVKIDRFASQYVFEIKSSMQVLASIFSFFKTPVDYVNHRFVTVRMNEYYSKIEKLVNTTRNLFPKSNLKRNNQLKRTSPFVFKVVEVIRSWNIEQLAKNIAELQSHPRVVKVADFADVLKDIYKQMYYLSDLNTEHIKIAFKLVYKILYIESPIEAKEKYQDMIRAIISAFLDVRKYVLFGMYPMLMKLISDRYIPYERFYIERRNRYMAFLGVKETDQLNAADLGPQQIDNIDVETLQQTLQEEEKEIEEAVEAEEKEAEEKTEDPNDPKVVERKAKEESEKAEQRAIDHGLAALETLFPKAQWDKLSEFPDLFPYFANVYSLRHGYELIAPSDPLQQVAVLMNILEDLSMALRYVLFSAINGPDGYTIKLNEEMGDVIENWRRYIEDSFSKDYLPRLSEYCRILENSGESRGTPYAKKTLNECHWVKRLYFLPYYKFESLGPPPFPKADIIPIYSIVRKLRRNLTAIATGIEQGIRAGGAAAKAQCAGINNPWEKYNFQIPNPVSKRLDMMLPQERRINATVIFFSLSVATVLDHIINNENSWAYGNRPGPLFRSIKDEGLIPLFGVDEKLDADQIFKESLKKLNNPNAAGQNVGTPTPSGSAKT